MGADQPVKQHGERLLSGIAQQQPNDKLGSIAVPAVEGCNSYIFVPFW
jgi:hypothetical protein